MINIIKQIVKKPTLCVATKAADQVAKEIWELTRISIHYNLIEMLNEDFLCLKCKVEESINILISSL